MRDLSHTYLLWAVFDHARLVYVILFPALSGCGEMINSSMTKTHRDIILVSNVCLCIVRVRVCVCVCVCVSVCVCMYTPVLF